MTIWLLAAIAQAALSHEAAESRTANSTLALAWITGVLAIATIVLAIFTIRLWRDAHEASTRSKTDAEEIRTLMSAQQEAMEGQAAAARDQARHAEASAMIFERQFSATFRPRLILRRITFFPADGAGHGAQLKIQLDDVGFGGAVVTRFTSALFPTFEETAPEPWWIVQALEGEDGNGGNPVQYAVPLGGSLALFRDYEDPEPVLPLRAFESSGYVFCAGYVEYTSADGIGSYRLGFIRRCDATHHVFTRVDDSDFEYQD